jgi:uncharacterized membrane protein YqhA
MKETHDTPAARPLDYDARAGRRPASPWARAFILSGAYALACIPAVFVFERLGWSEAPLHTSSFFACILCVISASMYLWTTRASVTGESPRHHVTKILAYIALALAGGFLLLVVLLIILLTSTMDDF